MQSVSHPFNIWFNFCLTCQLRNSSAYAYQCSTHYPGPCWYVTFLCTLFLCTPDLDPLRRMRTGAILVLLGIIIIYLDLPRDLGCHLDMENICNTVQSIFREDCFAVLSGRKNQDRSFLRILLLEKCSQRVLVALVPASPFFDRKRMVTHCTNLRLVVEHMVTHCTNLWLVVG